MPCCRSIKGNTVQMLTTIEFKLNCERTTILELNLKPFICIINEHPIAHSSLSSQNMFLLLHWGIQNNIVSMDTMYNSLYDDSCAQKIRNDISNRMRNVYKKRDVQFYFDGVIHTLI